MQTQSNLLNLINNNFSKILLKKTGRTKGYLMNFKKMIINKINLLKKTNNNNNNS